MSQVHHSWSYHPLRLPVRSAQSPEKLQCILTGNSNVNDYCTSTLDTLRLSEQRLFALKAAPHRLLHLFCPQTNKSTVWPIPYMNILLPPWTRACSGTGIPRWKFIFHVLELPSVNSNMSCPIHAFSKIHTAQAGRQKFIPATSMCARVWTDSKLWIMMAYQMTDLQPMYCQGICYRTFGTELSQCNPSNLKPSFYKFVDCVVLATASSPWTHCWGRNLRRTLTRNFSFSRKRKRSTQLDNTVFSASSFSPFYEYAVLHSTVICKAA